MSKEAIGLEALQEIEELIEQRDQLHELLRRTANALKGQPAELSRHSWHDLPELAQQLKAQQEPVGYIDAETLRRWDSLRGTEYECDEKCYMPFSRNAPHKSEFHDCSLAVYIRPQPPTQRTWAGLTDEEIYMHCPNWLSQEQCKVWIQQVEVKLKEKNT
jgi:hypothetical protein